MYIVRRTGCPACGSARVRVAFTRADWQVVAQASVDSRRDFARAMAAEPALGFEAFLVCEDCATLFADRVPPPALLEQFYQDYHGNPGYAEKIPRKLALERRRIFALKFLTRGRRFLDIGCNIGCAVEAARRSGFTATGLELDAGAVAAAARRFPGNRFLVGTLETLAPGQYFDLVQCTEVVEHVPAPRDFLARLGAVVAPGGIALITTPDAGHRSVREALLEWPEVKPPEHLTLFSRAGMRAALAGQFDLVWILPNRKPGLQVIARRNRAPKARA